MTPDQPRRLCASLRLAVEILAMNREKTPATTTALVERLDGVMDRNTVSNALDELGDYGVVEGHYGPVGGGRAGYHYEISFAATPLIENFAESLRKGEIVYPGEGGRTPKEEKEVNPDGNQ